MASDAAAMVASVARSHVGRVRAVNEDRVFDCPERCLWAVADGMGGHHGGDVAAQMVIEAFRQPCEDRPGAAPAMLEAIGAANRTIVRRNRAEGTDAGSTVVAAHLAGRIATIAWVGDSRAYLIRGRTVSLLTHDHSLVQDLIDAGLLTPAAAMHHPQANVVTRALGIADSVDIAVRRVSVLDGDRLLLCSDGLSRSLDDGNLSCGQPLPAFADTLIAGALERDGRDNISLVTIEIAASPAALRAARPPLGQQRAWWP
ncbi:PP2C family protein-serine/threonine phosphatase [Sphingomonas endolithica]|uniref:PP2C family protein-serine/threonine phosphatase n=1 Tax=Sphingomonas endolithica TaxID=2972485 RepID=UPI0021AF32D9|nr:protein phosphatase 2C domain-containing protein [Sphingomonas sp. ZFBP2030]